MLMERHAITDEQAFAYLRRLSQETNTKLRVVAETVVSSRQADGRSGQH
jgi:AmiR/NasT family two-component response regulator